MMVGIITSMVNIVDPKRLYRIRWAAQKLEDDFKLKEFLLQKALEKLILGDDTEDYKETLKRLNERMSLLYFFELKSNDDQRKAMEEYSRDEKGPGIPG